MSRISGFILSYSKAVLVAQLADADLCHHILKLWVCSRHSSEERWEEQGGGWEEVSRGSSSSRF